MAGHAAHDKYESYMPMELLAEWSDKDPLKRLEQTLRDERAIDERRLEGIRARVKDEVHGGCGAGRRRRLCRPRPRRILACSPSRAGVRTMPELTYLEAIRTAMHDEMEIDERVFVMGEDVGRQGGAFGATKELQQRFGELRSIDTPVAESGIVGVAVGAAMAGQRPIAEMQFADFVSCAFDQLITCAAKMHYRIGWAVPMVVRCPNGGGVGGGPYHSENVEAWFHHHAGLKIVCPATATDAYGLLRSAIRDPNPVVFCEHKFLYRRVKEEVITGPRDGLLVPLGEASVAARGLRPLNHHLRLDRAAGAGSGRHALGEEGVSVEVIDLRCLVPFDRETVLASVRKTGKALIVHEDNLTGGFGGEVAAVIAQEAFEHLDAPVRRVAALDTPIPFSPPLEREYLPLEDDILAAARDLAAY